MDKNLYGRLLLKSELSPEDFSYAQKLDSMSDLSKSKIQCNRCGTIHLKKNVKLPAGGYYCPECILLGRVRSTEALYAFEQQEFDGQNTLNWSGNLTKNQEIISKEIVNAVKFDGSLLVHAVTGSGKTEMLYAALDFALQSGKSIALVSPRIDVCIELHKRLSRDFSLDIPLLYAQGDKYYRSPLIIATTHQMLRFHDAFDVIIVDEVDSFPYVDNPMLHWAVYHAKKAKSATIYLTATSTKTLDKQVKSGQLKKVELARRFHGFPLIVPKFIWISKFEKEFKKQRKSKFPLLIFVANISFGQKFAEDLQNQFPDEKIAFVSSKTENRLQLIEDFRQNKIDVLITTTILERGVTFPNVDCFVYDSSHQLFSSSALIQIAGRVGRSAERPKGLVYFLHDGKNQAMIDCRKQIIAMNKKGNF